MLEIDLMIHVRLRFTMKYAMIGIVDCRELYLLKIVCYTYKKRILHREDLVKNMLWG